MSKIHSILFDRRYFSGDNVLTWAINNNYNYDNPRTTKRYIRLNLLPEGKNRIYYIKEHEPGIKFIMESKIPLKIYNVNF